MTRVSADKTFRRFLLFSLFVPLPVLAAVDFKNADFELKLGSDWTRTVLVGAEHLYFASKRANVSIKIDSLRKGAKPENFEKAAKALIERGIKREHDENPAGSVTIVNHGVSRLKDGARATYSGRDGTQRSFKFVGFLTEKKFVYLYFETPTHFENRLELVVDEVLQGFQY